MNTFQPIPLLFFLLGFATGDPHIRLKSLQREFFSWRLNDRPEFGTSMGDGRMADRLERYDLQLMTERVEHAQEFLDKLVDIYKDNLSKRDQMDYTIMQNMLETYIEGYKWRNWNYLTPMSWLEGHQRDPYWFVSTFNYFDTRGDIENYITRLIEIPRLFDEYKTFMNEAIRLGRTQHPRSIDRVPEQIDKVLKETIEESVYYIPIRDWLESFNMTAADSNGVKNDIQLRGQQAVQGVFDAYREIKSYVQDVYMRHARKNEGWGSLENGREFYKACLHWYLSLDITPEEIHELGLKEVERVKTIMSEIIEKQGYGNLTLREYFAELRKREDMILKNDDEILHEYENIIHNRVGPIINKLFMDQPGLPIVVELMNFDGPRGWYASGSADGERPGIFYANTFRTVPKFMMPSLSMHEANPGHHLQISYAATTDLPDFRRNGESSEKFRVPFAFPTYDAYMEGWALYAESLGVETGVFEKDYELMGYYESEIFRAARLVVDTGLHYFNWSREEAISYFMDNTANLIEGATLEVDRYISWPGQAVAYKIGELRIRELRKMAEKELGKKFDIQEFHMVILKNGAVPLMVLDQEVYDWIAERKQRSLEEEELKLAESSMDECECDEAYSILPTTPKSSGGRILRCRRSSSSSVLAVEGRGRNGGVRNSGLPWSVVFAAVCVVGFIRSRV